MPAAHLASVKPCPETRYRSRETFPKEQFPRRYTAFIVAVRERGKPKMAKRQVVGLRPKAKRTNRYRVPLSRAEVGHLLEILKHLKGNMPQTTLVKPMWLF
jgi:hypothetical protein